MKIALGLSLLLNLVLVVLIMRQDSRPKLERIVIEKYAEEKPSSLEPQSLAATVKPNKKKKKVDAEGHEIFDPQDFTQEEFSELAQAPDIARKEYMTIELNIPDEKLQKHEELRLEYFTATSKFHTQDPTGELSLADRKMMLQLEETYQEKVRKLYGAANWEKFDKYRRKYNADVIKRSRSDGTPPFLMMP